MTNATRIRLLSSLAVILIVTPVGPAGAGSSVFTYQGQLKFAGAPINGDCDLTFRLFDSVDAAMPIRSTQKDSVPVKTGLFTVQLDFGADKFPGADRWLEVAGRCPAGSGDFSTFTPRQPVTTVPYAIRAMNANVLDAPGGGPANALVVDPIGRIGIGTTSTSQLAIKGPDALDLVGGQPFLTLTDSAAGNERARIQNVGGSLIFAPESNITGTNSSSFLFLEDGSGSLGIGTFEPNSKLEVVSGGGDVIRGVGYEPYITLNDSHHEYRASRIQGVDGHLSFQTDGVVQGYNPSGLMVLRNDTGNLGIGTIEPHSRLEVASGSGDVIKGVGYEPFLTLSDASHSYRQIRVQGVDGHINFQTDGAVAGYNNLGFMVLRNDTGNLGIGVNMPQAKLDVGGRARAMSVEITGGGDLAEPFRITARPGHAIEPGMVVVIDPEHPGELVLSSNAYDRRVAGVISGAHGLSPGLVMAARGDASADGDHAVALTGRVWTHCDATDGAIEPGDFLTTSDKPGHAMKVADHARAQGAVLGKAMTRLVRGETGVVLTLVSLQ